MTPRKTTPTLTTDPEGRELDENEEEARLAEAWREYEEWLSELSSLEGGTSETKPV